MCIADVRAFAYELLGQSVPATTQNIIVRLIRIDGVIAVSIDDPHVRSAHLVGIYISAMNSNAITLDDVMHIAKSGTPAAATTDTVLLVTAVGEDWFAVCAPLGNCCSLVFSTTTRSSHSIRACCACG